MIMFQDLDVRSQSLIQKHLDLVREANNTVNLTRIISNEEAQLLHIEDSLSVLSELDKAPFGLYGDLGSGAGYPGIPLAIVSGRTTYLIDARKKKMDRVQKIIDELGLEEQIFTYAGRAELLARIMPEKFSVLTARALAKIPVLLELAAPLLKRGGHLICFKSHLEEDEINQSNKVASLVGMKLLTRRDFELQDDRNNQSYSRCLVVYEKVAKPKIKLPRQEGMAQKKPLV